MCAVVIIFIKSIINLLVTEIIPTVKKLDAVIIVALITGTLSLLAIIMGKVIEFRLSNKRYLMEKREVAYLILVKIYYNIYNKEGGYLEKDMLQDFKEFSEKVTLWGSSNVIKKWVKCRKCKDIEGINYLLLFEEVIYEMRKDMGYKKLGKGEILSLIINDIDEHLIK